jgi:ABC-type multidrug transport system fused ATPase/permease subunit
LISLLKKAWHVQEPEEKKAASILFFLMLLGMLLECLGIGIILPILSLLHDEELVGKYPEFAQFVEWIGNPSHGGLIVVLFGVLLILFILKNLFLLYLSWRQSTFAYSVIGNLSTRLLTRYLHQPYSFHLTRNSGNLIRNTTSEVGMFGFNFLIPGLNVIAEGLVFLGLSIMLLLVEPLGTAIVVGTLAILWALFQKPLSNFLSRHGTLRQKYDGLRVTHIQESLGSVKDLKVLGREDEFLEAFGPLNRKWARSGRFQQIFQRIPTFATEVVAIMAICLLVFVMIYSGKELSSVVPALGLFGAVAFRLLPSSNRILSSLQAMSFGVPVIEVLSSELKLDSKEGISNGSSPISFEKEIKVSDVSFCYETGGRAALSEVNLTIGVGQSVGLIGQSGSGKSTTVDVILGLFAPQEGDVFIDGTKISSNLRSWQNQIGYVPQSIFLIDKSIRRNIALGVPPDEIDEEALEQAIKSAQLRDFVQELPDGLNTLVGERGVRLSGGQRQRIGIARALYHNPSVLVLDEATSALDTETESEIMQDVHALKGDKTIIIVAHRLSTLVNCDKLYRFDKGRIVETGSPEDIISK